MNECDFIMFECNENIKSGHDAACEHEIITPLPL